MNELTIAVLVILGVCTISGYCRGFIRILVSLMSMVLTIALVTIVTPYISDFLMRETRLYETIQDKVVDAFADTNAQRDNTITANQVLTIESYEIPDILKEGLIENNNTEIYQRLMVDIFEDYIGGYIAKLIINALAFAATFLMITIFLRFTILSLHIISKIPIIKGLNKIAGAFAGLAEGVVLVWIGFLFAMLFCGNEIGDKLMMYVSQSPFLTLIFNTNYLLKLVMGLM